MKKYANGKITDRISVAGNPIYPAYVIQGDKKNLMLEAGINLYGSLYIESLKEILGDPQKLDYLFVTHSHYDHLGAAYYLKEKIPGLKTGGYGRINTLLNKQSVIDRMNSMSEHLRPVFKDIAGDEDYSIKPFNLDLELNEGDEIDLGGITCRVLYTPGHTRDSLSFYFPEINAVFPGECIGVPEGVDGDAIQVVFLTSFEDYIQSIKKIMDLKPDLIGMGHGFVYSGEDASEFLKQSLEASYEYKILIENYLKQAEWDIEKAKNEIVRKEYDEKKTIQQEKNAYIANLTAQLKLMSAN